MPLIWGSNLYSPPLWPIQHMHESSILFFAVNSEVIKEREKRVECKVSSATPWFFYHNRHYLGFVGTSQRQSMIRQSNLLMVKAFMRKQSYTSIVWSIESEPPLIDVNVSRLALPSKKGNEVVIILNESIYQQSIQEYKSNLIGNIIFACRTNLILIEEVCW